MMNGLLRRTVGNELRVSARTICTIGTSKDTGNKPPANKTNKKAKSGGSSTTNPKHISACNSPSIGINGFGRIGKCLLRLAATHNINVVAINQPCSNARDIGHSLRQDTVHGPFAGTVTVRKDALCVNGKRIHCHSKERAEEIPWSDQSVDYVIDASGRFDTLEKAGRYLTAGAKKVIVTSPSKDIPMFVRGVNYESYNKNTMPVVSSTSGTTNCAAPLLNLLHNKFGIESCLLTATHAVTARQNIHDGMLHRAAMNIIPNPTAASKALGKIIPALDGKVCGNAARVPVLDVSLLKLYIKAKYFQMKSLGTLFDALHILGFGFEYNMYSWSIIKEATKEDIESEIRKEANCNLRDLVTYFEDQKFVSSDFLGSTYSAVVDFNQTQVIDNKFISIGAWYDNEIGYSHRVLDLVEHMMLEDESTK